MSPCCADSLWPMATPTEALSICVSSATHGLALPGVMAEITIQLSDKALSLIAQLQKEIFNRRRKKVTPAGVVETLVESGAKSQ